MDIKNVVKLVKLMEDHGLDEMEVEEGDLHIRLKKGGTTYHHPAPVVTPVMTSVPMPGPQNGGAGVPAAPAPAASEPAPAAEKDDTVGINSPMVGTFYRSPSPDADPFVNEGDKVTPDTVIGIIEAMKVMNEIKAEAEGEIVSILVENGESIEFGQPLMTIRPSTSA